LIDLIEISNFQPHEYTVLELEPGVNVIKGQSHTGKSSIMRAIRWAIINKPRGDAFKSSFARPSDTVSVGIALTDGQSITREKGRTNLYLVDGEVLAAVKSDVPEEVQSIMHLNDINIHTQLDGPFLILASPGEVARNLNEAVGLNIIDELLKGVNRIALQSRREVKSIDERIENTATKIKNLSWIDKTKPVIDELRKMELERQIWVVRIKSIKDITNRHELLKNNVDEMIEWLAVEKPANELLNLLEDIREHKTQFNKINNLLIEHNKVQSRMDKLKSMLSIEQTVDTLIGKYNKSRELQRESVGLINLGNDIGKTSTAIRIAKQAVTDSEKAFAEALKQMKVCPMCGQKVA